MRKSWLLVSLRPVPPKPALSVRGKLPYPMPMPQTWSITALSQEFKVTPRAIRFYEGMGLITPVREGQRRIYGPRERTRLKLILRGKRLGFSLEDIREIIDMYDVTGEAAQLRALLVKLRQRRIQLRQQQDDIAVILGELDNIESQCVEALRAG